MRLPIDALLNKTFYTVPNNNLMFFDYTIFKTYATPELFDRIMDHVLKVLDENIEKYKTFHLAMDLNTFSVSAFERYKNGIALFNEKCLTRNNTYSLLTEELTILNTPNVIELIKTVAMPFVAEELRAKFRFIDKNASVSILQRIKSI
jgi:hypothetical protein